MKRNMLLLAGPLGVMLMLLSFSSARAVFVYTDVDTFKVIDTWGSAGDTVGVPIHFVNTPVVASINFRFEYDSSRLSVVGMTTHSTRLDTLNWIIWVNDTLPGLFLFVGTDLLMQDMLEPGAGPIAYVLFTIDPGCIQGEVPISFEDDPSKVPPIQNCFADSAATANYIPIQVHGYLRICPEGSCPPVLNPIPGGNLQWAFAGDTLNFDVSGYDHDGDWVTLFASDLPPHATFPAVEGDGSVAGTFTFAPDSAQIGNIYSVVFTIRDDGSPQRADVDTVRIAVPSDPSLFVRGDANADGDHDIYDGVRILYWIGGTANPPPCVNAADADDDEDVDIFDGLGIIYWMGGEQPDPPWPCCRIPGDCGPDLTPGGLPCHIYPPCE